jgi:outer membrane receptor for ferrienterochelin and colicin
VGNADLNAERTIMYEVGLQQKLFDKFYFHLIGFYRDIRDWIGISAPINTYSARTTYFKYINKDHAASQGVTLTGTYRSRGLSVNLDYTYMVAKGTTSDPRDEYNDALAQREPRLQLIYLDWDQTHNFIMTLAYAHESWYGSLIGRIQSGFPYTPTEAIGEAVGSNALIGYRENSAKRPTTYNVDLRLSKTFFVWDLRMILSLNVYNLFDLDNVRSVYSDTGRPDYSTESRRREDRITEIASIQELYNNPGNYYQPRFIQLGFGIGL